MSWARSNRDRYEYLTHAPAKTLQLIYGCLGEAAFGHDFSNVEYDEPEFDGALNTPGLHKVGRQVRFEERRTLLPPDLFERFDRLSFWNDPAPSLANLIRPVAQQPARHWACMAAGHVRAQ